MLKGHKVSVGSVLLRAALNVTTPNNAKYLTDLLLELLLELSGKNQELIDNKLYDVFKAFLQKTDS